MKNEMVGNGKQIILSQNVKHTIHNEYKLMVYMYFGNLYETK